MTTTMKFPLHTLGSLVTFAALMVGVHHYTAGAKGVDVASALAPIAAFHGDLSAWSPVVPLPPLEFPHTLDIPHPPTGKMSGATAAFLAANPQAQTEFLQDDKGSLDHLYAAMLADESGNGSGVVRIVHYGDSPTTADLITGDAREILQSRFGDGGPGYLLIARPWAWYGHHGIDLTGDGWKIDTAVGSMHPAAYGLGGAAFTGSTGAVSRIKLQHADATTVELQYAQQEAGGTVEVSADGDVVGTVDTAGKEEQVASKSFNIPAGSRLIELKVASGTVKLYGVALGHAGRGLTYDSLGLNGASTTAMSRAFDEGNWAAALQHRAPDLVIINYGTNESSFPAYVEKQYEPELRRAIARVRAALPSASILVMSPMDRGARGDGNSITTMPAIPVLVDIQKRVAQDAGCAFFNTYAAMGGEGTMAKWYTGHPSMVAADLIHPSPQGARIVAQALTGQVLIGYERYVQAHTAHR